jgi:hypothetical protein
MNLDEHMVLEAHRYWMGLLMIHTALQRPLTSELIVQHLDDLKNGVPIDHLDPNGPLNPATWDEENLLRYPAYEAVGLELAARIDRYLVSGDIHELAGNR